VAALTVVVVVGCNVAFVRAVGVGDETLIAAASGTSTGTAFALLAIGAAVRLRFGAFIPPLSALRTLAAAAVGWLVAGQVPSDSAVSALLALIAGGLAYLAALVVVGELGRKELDSILTVVRRRTA
jgi:hypothetical protein